MPRDNLPLDLLARLDPVQVKEYAKATGWVREPRISDGVIAVYAHPTSDLDQIIVPLARGSSAFARAMGDVVNILAEREKRPAGEVLNDLLLPPADVLRFNEAGPVAAAGDVPLDHGIDMLIGARKQVRAAACSERRPQRYHPRMSLAEAEQLLQECRLAQTERGSFTITVACPLYAVPNTDPVIDQTPFTRRVTGLLMRSLHRLSLALDADELDPLLTPTPDEPVISANLCEGLLDMTPEGEGSTLTISASWARTLPPPATVPLPRIVKLRRETFPLIEKLAGKLRPEHAPQRQTLFGFVDTLNGRPNADNEMEGQVILRLVDPESDTIRARTDLNVADYHTAWLAHGQNQPITLQGIVRRVGRTFRIDEVTGFRLLQQTPAAQTEAT
jgi:hypothetical protein